MLPFASCPFIKRKADLTRSLKSADSGTSEEVLLNNEYSQQGVLKKKLKVYLLQNSYSSQNGHLL
jgi:hypothetical protein